MPDRCALCPAVNVCIEPDGPDDSDLLFVGEAPNYQDNKEGIPFQGKPGIEVDRTYLPSAGLKRANVRFTNAIRCLPDRDKGRLDNKDKRDIALLESCAHHFLYPDIEQTQPKLLIPMGVFACRAIEIEIELGKHHGIPLHTSRGIVFPMFHPSQGIHEPKRMLQIRTDWVRLRRYLRGTLSVWEDQYPDPDYQEVESVYEIRSLDPTLPMACDTESSRRLGPYCLTYSNQPGTGRLIRAERTDLLEEFQHWLDRWESDLIFHNWLYDRRVVEEMGLVFPNRLIRDTMQIAFNLGNVPLGLKALAYRELGMDMEDFEDLVRPYSTLEVLKYLSHGMTIEWPKPEARMERSKEGVWKLKRPRGMGTKLKVFFKSYGKSPDTKDVFGAWDNWEDQHSEIEELMGPWPGMDINHVPFDKVLTYAVRDADATLRLLPILLEMREVAHTGAPQENWRQ